MSPPATLSQRPSMRLLSGIHPPSLPISNAAPHLSTAIDSSSSSPTPPPPPPLALVHRPRRPRVPRRAHVKAADSLLSQSQHPAAHPTSNTRAYFLPCSTAQEPPAGPDWLRSAASTLRLPLPTSQPAAKRKERADCELVTALVRPPTTHPARASRPPHKPDHLRFVHLSPDFSCLSRPTGPCFAHQQSALPVFSLTERA